MMSADGVLVFSLASSIQVDVMLNLVLGAVSIEAEKDVSAATTLGQCPNWLYPHRMSSREAWESEKEYKIRKKWVQRVFLSTVDYGFGKVIGTVLSDDSGSNTGERGGFCYKHEHGESVLMDR
jgi:hypothetical protein